MSTLGRIVGDHPDGELLDTEGLFQKGREVEQLDQVLGRRSRADYEGVALSGCSCWHTLRRV